VVSEIVPVCKKCKAPLEEGLRTNPLKMCQGCIDVAIHARLFPEQTNTTDLAGVTQIP
jgi:hypothetical protein